MKTIGIKLADGTFYPIMEEGEVKRRELEVTTAKDNQNEVRIDLYRSDDKAGTNAEYVETLSVPNLNPHPNGEPNIKLSISLDENGELSAQVVDRETGSRQDKKVPLPKISPSVQPFFQDDLSDMTINDLTPEKTDNFETENIDLSDLDIPDEAETVENDFDSDETALSVDELSNLAGNLGEVEDEDAPIADEDLPSDSVDSNESTDSNEKFDDFALPDEAETPENDFDSDETALSVDELSNLAGNLGEVEDEDAPIADEDLPSDSVDSNESTDSNEKFDDFAIPDEVEIPENDFDSDETALSVDELSNLAGNLGEVEDEDAPIADEDLSSDSNDSTESSEKFDDFAIPNEAETPENDFDSDETALSVDELSNLAGNLGEVEDEDAPIADEDLPSDSVDSTEKFDDLDIPNEAETPENDFDSDETALSVDELSNLAGNLGEVEDEDAPIADESIDVPAEHDLEDETIETSVSENELSLPDFDEKEENMEKSLDLPDFDDEPKSNDDASSFDMPDFDEKPAAEEKSLDLPDFDEEPKSNDDAGSFDMPDFDEKPAAEEKSLDLPDFDEKPETEESSFDLPDFDAPVENHSPTSKIFDFPDFDEHKIDADAAAESFDSFDLPDFDNSANSDSAKSFDFSDFDDSSDSLESQQDDPFGSDFSSLYKDSEGFDEEERRSKSPILVIIIVILLCLIAAAALLFIFPSRFNILKNESSFKMPTFITNIFENFGKKDAKDAKKENPAQIQEQTEVPKKESSDEKIENQVPETADSKEKQNLTQTNDEPVSSEVSDLIGKFSESIKKENGESKEKSDETKSEPVSSENLDKPYDSAENAAKKNAQSEKAESNDKIIIEPDASKVVPSELTAPQAEEDKIVIAPDASKVVPVAKHELTIKKDDIKHHVKWGDTLWDISETYYKNPWRYPRIAKHNNIPNPDFIMAGKDLLVPYE